MHTVVSKSDLRLMEKVAQWVGRLDGNRGSAYMQIVRR